MPNVDVFMRAKFYAHSLLMGLLGLHTFYASCSLMGLSGLNFYACSCLMDFSGLYFFPGGFYRVGFLCF